MLFLTVSGMILGNIASLFYICSLLLFVFCINMDHEQEIVLSFLRQSFFIVLRARNETGLSSFVHFRLIKFCSFYINFVKSLGKLHEYGPYF